MLIQFSILLFQVLLLGYDCFEFIKILVKSRDMVLYCTLLLTCQSDAEREKLIETMKKKVQLKKILNQLEGEDEDGNEISR